MKFILYLINKSQYIILFSIILLIFACIRKEWENPLDSDNSLDHISSINISRPSSSDELYFGFKEYITWDNHEYDDNVKIVLLKDGNLLNTIVNEAPNNMGEFRWSVPLTGIEFGKDYNIVVSSINNYFVKDTSKNFIMRQAPEIEINDFNSGDSVEVDFEYPIIWKADSLNHRVKIECYRGNESEPIKLISISTGNDGEHIWQIPINGFYEHKDYKIRISSTYNEEVKQEEHFNVLWPDFNLRYPYDGTQLVAGNYYDIKYIAKWNNNPQNNRKIWLGLYNWVFNPTSGWYDIIVDSTDNTGVYNYLLPINTDTSDSYHINFGIVGSKNIQAIDGEINHHTEWPKFKVIWPDLKILEPKNGDILTMGDEYTIIWDSYTEFSSTNLVKISLILNDNEIDVLKNDMQNIKQWNWNIPTDTYQESNNYKIKIEVIANPKIFHISDNFSLEKN